MNDLGKDFEYFWYVYKQYPKQFKENKKYKNLKIKQNSINHKNEKIK